VAFYRRLRKTPIFAKMAIGIKLALSKGKIGATHGVFGTLF